MSGFVVSKLVKKISCSSWKNCLLSQFNPATSDHGYCSVKFSQVASAFTLFVNNGGLRIPSELVYLVVEYAEKEFKASVCKDCYQITRGGKLKEKTRDECLLIFHHGFKQTYFSGSQTRVERGTV